MDWRTPPSNEIEVMVYRLTVAFGWEGEPIEYLNVVIPPGLFKKQWFEAMIHIHERHGSWNERKNYKSWNFSEAL